MAINAPVRTLCVQIRCVKLLAREVKMRPEVLSTEPKTPVLRKPIFFISGPANKPAKASRSVYLGVEGLSEDLSLIYFSFVKYLRN